MSKKSILIIVIIVVVIGLGAGAYALFHKSSTASPKTPSTTSKTVKSDSIVQTKTTSNVGSYLADENGNALYTYSKDTSGVSNCNGSCLLGWPVYTPTSSSQTLPTNVTVITRSDGTSQYAYKGLPLYTFSGDTSGNVNGNGLSGFAIAKP